MEVFGEQSNVQAMKLVLTCEHAFNDIPVEYQYLFKNNLAVLKSHRGYDPGAFDLFKTLENLADYSKYQSVSRLLIETNRSQGHKNLFSEFSKGLEKMEKSLILQKYYYSYRNNIEAVIHDFLSDGEAVLHLSIHSFTPVLNGEERKCDLGLLYDPQRKAEKELCRKFKKNLLVENAGLNIRMNYPYLGKADGFTTYLRKKFENNYSGIELEVNQKWVKDNAVNKELKENIRKALGALVK